MARKPDTQVAGTRARATNGRFTSVKEAGSKVALIEEQRDLAVNELLRLEERLVELEFALEDEGWRTVGSTDDMEFSNTGLDRIIRLCRLAYLKNPLINHGVDVTCNYVFGQGWTISGHDKVGQVIDEVMTDKNNLAVLTSHAAMLDRERQQQTEGNTFIVLFTNEANGYTRFSTIPTTEILAGDIIRNPDNRMEVWYYKRVFSSSTFDQSSGNFNSESKIEYYPDWRYEPTDKPDKIGDHPVRWDRPVYHVKTGGLPGSKFGVPDVYQAVDWAKAVTEDLEDYASLRKALSRFAWQLTTPAGKKAVAAARQKLNATLPSSELAERPKGGPPPAVASVAISPEGYNLNPIRTAGAAPSPEEGRRLWYMVSAGVGIPEPILAGDATLGTYATAKTLDRPTELKMKNRQSLWKDVFQDLMGYVIDQAIKAPDGLLPGTVVQDDRRGGETIEIGPDPDAPPAIDPVTNMPMEPEPMDRTVDVDFPDILEKDVDARVSAIIAAATLDGKPVAGTIPPKQLVRLLLSALGEQGEDIEAVLEVLFPSSAVEDDVPLEPTAPQTATDASTIGPDGLPMSPAEQAAAQNPPPGVPGQPQLAEAISDFREAALAAARTKQDGGS